MYYIIHNIIHNYIIYNYIYIYIIILYIYIMYLYCVYIIYYTYIYIYITIYIYSEVMKTIQCAHPPHCHNGFAAICRLWTASGGVHALLVLEPTVYSIGTKQGA